MRIGISFEDGSMARTIYYDMLSDAVRAHPGFASDPDSADVLFPAEDTAFETNWPRYARPGTAFARGAYDEAAHGSYLGRLATGSRRTCVVNMHPFIRVPLHMASRPHIVVADINLRRWERAINPRTISMPALPFATGTFDPDAKRQMASFRGVASHPCRAALLPLHDGHTIRIELVEPTNHFGRIDALNGVIDTTYRDMLHESIFAIVPRGDAEFSYRLLEVLSFGCIPVIISDGWVPPFDRTIAWDDMALFVPETSIAMLPAILAFMPPDRIASMQRAVLQAYDHHLAGFQQIAATLVAELATVLDLAPDPFTRAAT